MMEKDSLRTNYSRERTDGNLLRSSSDPAKQSPSSSDFGLQWGTRKRLRCTKNQIKDVQSGPVNRTTVRVDRRVVRTDKDSSNQPTNNNNNGSGNGYINLRQRPASPRAPPPHRVLRNSENFTAMRGQSNGVIKGCASSERGAHDKRGGVGGNLNNNNNHHHNNNNNDNNHHNNRNNKSATSSDSKKGGSSSGSGESIPLVWPSQFVLSLTNKEKEEDFMIIKGSKPSQRPKKRSKFIQRTLNLVSPGEWLCDISLERYEVREKKISKKRPRGLKAMSNMESDSE